MIEVGRSVLKKTKETEKLKKTPQTHPTFWTKLWGEKKKVKSDDKFLPHTVKKVRYSLDIYPFKYCYTVK